jgi:hypothetical protein
VEEVEVVAAVHVEKKIVISPMRGAGHNQVVCKGFIPTHG